MKELASETITLGQHGQQDADRAEREFRRRLKDLRHKNLP
jgi:hypothetical protein